MNIYFLVFLIVVVSITGFAYTSLNSRPFLSLITALLTALAGIFFGVNLELFGEYFKEQEAVFVGQSIVIITSIITGGLVSCSFSEIRENKKNKG